MTAGVLLRSSAVVAAAMIALGGCSGDGDDAAAGPDIIQPGSPGETATRIDPDDVEADPTPEFNEDDEHFVEMMVPHHQQAVQMAELAADRAKDTRVKEFASRIGDTQQVEIGSMQAWLTTRDRPKAKTTVSGHHAMHMPGMLSERDFRALAAARGTAFDRLYLRKMIGHHEGALEMADEALSKGIDAQNRTFASDLATSQTVEIERLEEILASL